jgi:hypothetical protein
MESECLYMSGRLEFAFEIQNSTVPRQTKESVAETSRV